MKQVIPNTSCLDMLRDLECPDTFQHSDRFTDSFIQLHTDFATVGGFFFALPKPERCTFELMDKYVKRHTEFETWITDAL